jgi:hypothetical protein
MLFNWSKYASNNQVIFAHSGSKHFKKLVPVLVVLVLISQVDIAFTDINFHLCITGVLSVSWILRTVVQTIFVCMCSLLHKITLNYKILKVVVMLKFKISLIF